MRQLKYLGLAIIALTIFSLASNAIIPTPKEHFGFTPGDDRMLFKYEELISYIEKLAQVSPLVHMEKAGQTELGRPMYNIFVSSAENINNLENLRQINRQLAMDEIPPGTDRNTLIENGKVFFLSALSMHSNEVGPIQALPLIIYELIAGDDPRNENILENTVAMFLPHNPDGMNMIVDHYNKYKGTIWETSHMPGVYHKYVGHNINRDFITLTQKENQVVAETYSTKWFPQAMVERHQMGSTGPRFFISPPSDPIAENVDAAIWNWMRIYGSRSLTSMTNAGLASVSVNYLFDNYWPGATSTSIWKGVIGMLSEAASVNIATPVYVEPNEIRPIGKGLSEYATSINLPRPWEGGWWRLSDILRYELENTYSYLHTSAMHRKEILQHRNDISLREVQRGKLEAPYYFIIPLEQHDPGEMVGIVNLLYRHGVKSYRLKEDATWENRIFRTGDVVIPLSQPYRAFIKEVLEAQKFPARHYTPGGEMIKPYDITSWSLPLHRGVNVVEINKPFEGLDDKIQSLSMPFTIKQPLTEGSTWALFTSAANESYKAAFAALKHGLGVERTSKAFKIGNRNFPAGSFLIPINNMFNTIEKELTVSPYYCTSKPDVETSQLKPPRIGLVETWFHDMDGGWTRFIFDKYQIPYTVLRPADLQTANLQRNFDILVFSDQQKSVLMNGKFEREGQLIPSRYPPDYAKGMEKKGFENLIRFINNGGKVMAWGPAVELFMGTISIGEEPNREEFVLPIRNIGPDLVSGGLYVPGALLRINLNNEHPLAWGMPEELGVFHRGTTVFRTSIPFFDMDRRVIGTFADDKILMSGYAEQEELLKNEPALVWVQKGKGQLILSSFNPQFRSSTAITYKLLFNALLID